MKVAADNRPLLGLFRTLMLFVLAAYLIAVAKLWDDNLDDIRASLVHVDSMLVQGVRTTLRGHELILRGLGSELISLGALDEPERGRGLIERMRAIDPGMAAFGLARPDGQLVLVSGIKGGEPLPNLSRQEATRDSFHEAIGNSPLSIGRPYYFEMLGQWVVPIRVPIQDASGKTRAVMTAGYAISGGTTAWANMALPPDVNIALMRDDGYVVYRQPLPPGPRAQALRDTYGLPVLPGTLAQVRALRAGNSFTQIYLPRAGGTHYVAYTGMPEYGLHVGAFIPRRVVIARWLQRLLAPSALLLVFLAGGRWAYKFASRRQTRADAEIRQLTAWQQALLDSAEYSIISTDTEGRIVSFNRAAQRMLGYTAAEVVGKVTPVILHDRAEIEQRARELGVELGEPITPGFEVFVARARRDGAEERTWTHTRKDGSCFPVRLSVTPLTATDGGIIGFMGIAADLSEQEAIRADLRDSEARYRNLFERAGDAILLIQGGHFVDCNPATLAMFACSRADIIGATPKEYSPEYQADGRRSRDLAEEMLEAAGRGAAPFFEWLHRRRDGSIFAAEVSLNAMEIGGRPHLMATVRDISARKRDEAELTRSRQELLERNESLSLLNRLSQRLHGSQALDDILRETEQALLGMSQTPHIAIYLLDREAQCLRLALSHGFAASLAQSAASLPLHGSLSGLALARGEPLTTSDIAHDERVEPEIKAALLQSRLTSGVAIPMIYQGQAFGTINLIYEQEHRFVKTERETLVSLSNTVALAIANARHMDSLAFQARHDSLTGLANRALLHETIEAYIEGAAQGKAALLLLDLDRFKEINDTLGHHIGDQALAQVGARLERACAGTLIARLGGDEFAIFVNDRAAVDVLRDLAGNVIEALRKPFPIAGIEARIGVSVGVAGYPEHGADSHALLRAADVAMYQAKKLGKGPLLYDPSFDDYSEDHLALANELMQALQGGQLRLHYQPKIDIASGASVGFEALVRWQHPRRGLLYPGAFLSLVEMSEVIHPFTEAVINLAVVDKRRLHDLGFHQPVAINLSARNLLDVRCFTSLEAAVEKHDLPASEIELELTETVLMQDPDGAAELMQRFADMGMHAAIDDFGTGYSSLLYLRKLPTFALKIDQSFVTHMLGSEQDRTIVRSTIALAHNLKLTAIAEGVEDIQTLDLLREMGCDQAQGYALCRPQPLELLIAWLSQDKPAS